MGPPAQNDYWISFSFEIKDSDLQDIVKWIFFKFFFLIDSI